MNPSLQISYFILKINKNVHSVIHVKIMISFSDVVPTRNKNKLYKRIKTTYQQTKLNIIWENYLRSMEI